MTMITAMITIMTTVAAVAAMVTTMHTITATITVTVVAAVVAVVVARAISTDHGLADDKKTRAWRGFFYGWHASVVRWRRLFGHAGDLARLYALQFIHQ